MKLVLIEWVDSHLLRGWNTIDDARTADDAMRIQSVGWVLAENKSAVVLAASVDRDEGCVAGHITIPRVCITKTTVLRR